MKESSNGWRRLLLAEVAEINPRNLSHTPSDLNAVTFVPMSAVEEESGNVDASQTRVWGEVRRGYTRFQENDVLLAKITPCMENGKFAVARKLHGGVGAGSTEFHVLRANPALVIPDWLLHFMLQRATRQAARAVMAGAVGQQRVPSSFLHELEIPIAPLADQRRIVSAIESHFSQLDAAVASLTRAKASVKRARASVLKAAVEGRLVPTEAALARAEGRDYEPASTLLTRILTERRARWSESGAKGKYKEPSAPEARRGKLPEGWVWATLDTVAVRIESGSGATAVSEPTTRRVLRSSAVRQGAIDWSDHRFLPESAPCLSNDDIKVGDLLFTRLSGSLAYVGNCALVRSVPGKFEFPDRIFRASLVPSICALFVQHCFEVQHLRTPLEASAKSTAGHQRISLSDLRTFMIPLPPLAEQRRIAAEVDRRLSVLDALDANLEANLARCAKLRQSILKRAFEGKLVRPDAAAPKAPQLPLFTEEAAP